MVSIAPKETKRYMAYLADENPARNRATDRRTASRIRNSNANSFRAETFFVRNSVFTT